MINFLSDLNLSNPSVRSKLFLAVRTLLVLNYELDEDLLLKSLVEFRDVFLYDTSYFDSLWVRLRPYEVCIDYFDLLQPFYFF